MSSNNEVPEILSGRGDISPGGLSGRRLSVVGDLLTLGVGCLGAAVLISLLTE